MPSVRQHFQTSPNSFEREMCVELDKINMYTLFYCFRNLQGIVEAVSKLLQIQLILIEETGNQYSCPYNIRYGCRSTIFWAYSTQISFEAS